MRSILYYIISKIKKLQSKDTEINTEISGIKQDITDINGDITDIKPRITALENINIIEAQSQNSLTIENSGEVQLPINKSTKIGTTFSIDNNKIIIGEGVHHILVWCNLYCNLVANRFSPFNITIKKNGNDITGLTNNNYDFTENQNKTFAVSPKLVEVSQGDYIEWFVYAYQGDTIRSENTSSYISVQAIN